MKDSEVKWLTYLCSPCAAPETAALDRLTQSKKNYSLRYMSMPAAPTSIRLSQAEKRQIAAAARKHGISVAAFIKRAALGAGVKSPDAGLARLEAMAKTLLDAIEEERDYRLAADSWDNHRSQKTRLYTGEELKLVAVGHRSSVYGD